MNRLIKKNSSLVLRLVCTILFSFPAYFCQEAPPAPMVDFEERDLSGILFYPRRASRTAPLHARDFDIPAGDGVKIGARWHRFNPDWPDVLLFHGNGENVADYDDVAADYRGLELNLFVVDFRGYGWSTGHPSLSSLEPDALAVAEFFLRKREKGPPPFLMGRSLGSASACSVARAKGDRFRGLIIESGFADFMHLLRRRGIDLGAREKDIQARYSNVRKLSGLKLPLLVLHGGADKLIPASHGRDLAAAIPGARLEIIEEAGHNNLLFFPERYFGAIGRFRRATVDRPER